MTAALWFLAGALAVTLIAVRLGRRMRQSLHDVRVALKECYVAKHEAWEARFEAGWERGVEAVRFSAEAHLLALPPLHCGQRDPHLRLSEVLAVVRGEQPVVKRKRVKAPAVNVVGTLPVTLGHMLNAGAPAEAIGVRYQSTNEMWDKGAPVETPGLDALTDGAEGEE